MTVPRPRWWLLCLGLLGPTRGALAQIAPADSAALIATTQGMMDAIVSGDTTAWAPWLLPQWFLTDEEGHHITRPEFLAQQHPIPTGQSAKIAVVNPHFGTAPGVIVLSYDADEWHNFYGQERHTVFHATDTWVGQAGAWKMLASQVTALPTPIEGRRVDKSLLDPYAGTYRLTSEIALTIAVGDSGITMTRGSGAPERLFAIDDRIFIRHGVRGFWLFERDQQGAVVRLVYWRDNNSVVWRRE
ncbi:MAG TPA: nuclear transport factor 2 family protein [Gemmatimonadales bacterium]|nr:nuclear transport factor 2 family protein [Gemmatimonadales bacterium]